MPDAQAITQAANERGVGRARAYANASSDTLAISASISYERASCEYQMSNGLQVASARGDQPGAARDELCARAVRDRHSDTPHSAESERRGASL